MASSSRRVETGTHLLFGVKRTTFADIAPTACGESFPRARQRSHGRKARYPFKQG
jgi:hypothetical protein